MGETARPFWKKFVKEKTETVTKIETNHATEFENIGELESWCKQIIDSTSKVPANIFVCVAYIDASTKYFYENVHWTADGAAFNERAGVLGVIRATDSLNTIQFGIPLNVPNMAKDQYLYLEIISTPYNISSYTTAYSYAAWNKQTNCNTFRTPNSSFEINIMTLPISLTDNANLYPIRLAIYNTNIPKEISVNMFEGSIDSSVPPVHKALKMTMPKSLEKGYGFIEFDCYGNLTSNTRLFNETTTILASNIEVKEVNVDE